MYIFLANAAEGMENVEEKFMYDQTAMKLWGREPQGSGPLCYEIWSCYGRRMGEFVSYLGDLEGACAIFAKAEELYISIIDNMGINMRNIDHLLLPAMKACTSYTMALLAKGDTEHGFALLLDVQETQAILDGYREGIL